MASAMTTLDVDHGRRGRQRGQPLRLSPREAAPASLEGSDQWRTQCQEKEAVADGAEGIVAE